MADGREFKFTIDVLTPDALPMGRLAEYMADLARMFGETDSVHFVRLDSGSTVLVQRVDENAELKVRSRIRNVQSGEGPADALAAYERLNRRLLDDNAVADLADEKGNNIVRFPGREAKEPVTFGAFNQPGSLDGVLIRVGGVKDTVPITLQTADGLQVHCVATRDLAKTIAQYLFGQELRVHGNGRWYRDRTGEWQLKRFTVGRFEILGGDPLSVVVSRLRAVEGNEWTEAEDPWVELARERENPGKGN